MKKKKVDALDNKRRFQHEQHSKKFTQEVNSVTRHIPFQPFRISNEVWIIGKHTGKKLCDTPKEYIQWALKNMNLTSTMKSILQSYLK